MSRRPQRKTKERNARAKPLAGVYVMIKFFEKEEHLNDFIAGKMYCNTAEHYRFSERGGVGDPYESCAVSFREERDPPGFELVVDGHRLTEVRRFTMRNGDMRDNWMHCWTAFRMPRDSAELERLIADFHRMRREFGAHYAVLPSHHMAEAFRRIRAAAPFGATLHEVTYTDDGRKWSPLCKRKRYGYQREVRFLLGECPEERDAPLRFQVPGGLQDLIQKNADVRMMHRGGGEALFALNADGVFPAGSRSPRA